MFKLGSFVIFNSILPFTNVATDGVTFFDLLEDNMLDILIVTDTGSGRQINAIYNNID